MTLEELRSHTFVGNYHADSKTFTAGYAIVDDKGNSTADRAEALRIIMHKGMGLTGNEAMDHLGDEELLAWWASWPR